MAGKASTEVAEKLHGLVFEAVIQEIEAYRNAVDESGKPAPQRLPPALLSQAIKLLKDNGIDSPAAAKRLNDALARALPDLEDVETQHMGHA